MNEFKDGSDLYPTKRKHSWGSFRIYLLGLVALAIVGTVIYLLLARISETNQRIASLEQKLDTAVQTAETAQDKAKHAEQTAEEAVTARLKAEQERENAEKAAAAMRERAEMSEQTAASAQEEAEKARQEAEKLRKQREEEMNRLQSVLSKMVETRRTALGLVMNLGNSIEFDFDKATLRSVNRELLSRIVGVLLTSHDYHIYVYGHTDDVGSDEYNMDLSKRRADTVRDYLVKGGIDPSIISTKGYGKTRPLVSGKDPASRARNRRVELAIVNSNVDYHTAVADRDQ